ncbi:MAG: efflux RND transporter permease subunit [Flavitalea sp.]
MKNFHVRYKNPLSVLLLFIIAGGIFAYSKLQSSLFPEITFPKIKIIADAGLQPVDRMMVTVTKPLENAIRRVPDLEMIRSTTSRGTSEISVFMNWKSNIDLAQQQLESRISEIRNTLPPDVQLTIEKMNPSILPVMGYTLQSNQQSPIELKMLANYTIKPFLSQVAGVSEIRVIGGKTKEYWIELDPRKLSAVSLTPDSVSIALSNTNFIRSNGFISDYKLLYLTVTDATVGTLDELKKVIVRNDGKRLIRVGDVADVQIKEATEYTRINANGKDAVLIAVIKQPNANLIDLSSAMEKKVADLKKILPHSVAFDPYYVQANFVNRAVKSVADSLWIGLVLAIVVAIIFLRSVKASATILLTIPVTLALTAIVIYVYGYSLNIMTLGAIAAALGLIIDDAIVVVEQIHRTHEENPEAETNTLVQKAIRYLFPAMVGSSASTIVIFIPFVLMSGVAGAYFKVMTDTMIITLVCSFFVTWICLPVIYLLLTRKKNINKVPHKINIARDHKWIHFFINRPAFSIAIVLLLIGLIIVLIPKIQTGFLPDMEEGSIVLDYASPPGTSLEETDRMLRQVEKQLQKVPEVATYSRRTGTQMGFFITEPNTGDYLIQLKSKRNKTTEEVIEEIRQQVESTQPALRVDFGQVIGDMLGDLMSSVQPIEVKIFGNDKAQLTLLSKQVAAEIEKVPGTADVFDGIVIAGPSVSIVPDENRLAQFGITPADFQLQLQNLMQGNIVGSIFEKEQQSVVRMVYHDNVNTNVSALNQMEVFLPNGKLNPVASLASIKVNPGDAEINRENGQSMGVVTARMENSDLGTVIKNIQQRIEKNIHLPQGYYVTYGGAYSQQQQSFHELLLILIASSMLVFGVILFLFKAVRVAVLILLLAVLGIAGCLTGLYVTGTPLNVGSYTGLIMIVGIIAENAIFTFLQFRNSLVDGTPESAVAFAISARLRPKLMTALGAIIALMPLALGIGSGAQLHQPLAIAVIGGFVVALPLLLVVLPSFLFLLFRK